MMRWLRWLRWTLIVVAVLAALAVGARLVGHAPEPAAARRRRRTARRSAPRPPSSATRAASRSSPPPSRTDLAFATGLRARAGPLLPDGPVAAPGGGRVVGAVWRGGARSRTGARGASVSAPSRGGSSKRRPADERAVIEAYARGVNAGLAASRRGPGNTCCCARSRARGCRRIRCWWCTPCGGSCNTARCATRSAGAASSARRPRAATPAAAHDAHRLRLCRPLRLGHA